MNQEQEKENRYRRGFMHGYNRAIDDFRRYSAQEVCDFVNGLLAEWREDVLKAQCKTWEPPVISRARGVLSPDGQRIDKVIEADGSVSRTSVVSPPTL